ncbi:sulfurtransferase [Corynebacterium alimapuense]|uniref:Sulfurtransferase n=1 Tax=Corynebacterium alimapuense TaxID=1576874 RepID=A0A3M8K7A3_9CORY|nr:sulfurtransferase [Corynebacterium alimapuense]RNE49093.1 sulfurtransferase [Corynebacterium alimapuense]
MFISAQPLLNVEEMATLSDPPVLLCASMGPHPPARGIPGSYLADLEGDFSDPGSHLPHTAPAELTGLFESYGISDSSTVVVYDDQAGTAAPRVWWLALAAGLKNVYVLDGGLIAWRGNSGQVAEFSTPASRGKIVSAPCPELLLSADQIADGNRLVLDARSAERFHGRQPEPRPGLRGGHIPGSVNLPFTQVLDERGFFRPPAQLREALGEVVDKHRALTFSCGSGVTACIDALAAIVAGYEDVAIYEGSWSEWGRPDSGRDVAR